MMRLDKTNKTLREIVEVTCQFHQIPYDRLAMIAVNLECQTKNFYRRNARTIIGLKRALAIASAARNN